MPGSARSASRNGSASPRPRPCTPDRMPSKGVVCPMNVDNTKRSLNLRKAALVAALLSAVGGRLTAQEAVVTPLMTKELADMPGKEALMITVEYPPGSKDAVHRHNAHAFVYV